MWEYGCVHMSAGACGTQKKPLELVKLVLQMVIRCPVWMLVSQD